MVAPELVDAIRREARPLAGPDDVEPALAAIGDATLVLLGEATHGTHEFYRLRAALTQRLVAERGFRAVAVEADWPDALRVSRHLRGDPRLPDADAALGGFERFPRWMWRNAEVRDFVRWLRRHNERSHDAPVLFYGLDLYSLRASMHAVIDYLEQQDPALAAAARRRYDCFDGLADDPQRYGLATLHGLAPCEPAVVAQLQALLRDAGRLLRADGAGAADELFYAQQNARVVQGAERYYRAMFSGGAEAWNLRDTHMADTLAALRTHVGANAGAPGKLVVWAHNSHIGDARATELGWARDEINLGQLARERAPASQAPFLLGFTTHAGSVAAADDWEAPVQRMRVLPSHPESVERALHDSGLAAAFVPLGGALRPRFERERLERAIGVVYRPETERWSHYFGVHLARQFDAVIHVDRTQAVTPLDADAPWQPAGSEETYPTGL